MSSTDASARRDTAAFQACAQDRPILGQGRPRLYAYAPGVQRIPGLAALLDDFDLQYRPARFAAGRAGQGDPRDGVLAWGLRPSALRAQRYARRHGLSVYHVEDGFLRSVGLGADAPPLSIVFDDQGLYLDAAQPSRLESLVKQPLDAGQAERARALMQAWRAGRVSKYNHSRDLDPARALPADCVLVVDQTRGDASVRCGLADERTFAAMLDAALAEHPHSTIVLKAHPDVVAGRKQGYFDLAAARANPRIAVLDADAHPASLISHARQVYTATSQMGFEALLWGVPARVFGMPFYAGWGLTHDEMPPPARRGKVSMEQLAHAVLIDYCRYLDPETGRRCEVETLLAWLASQRRARQQGIASRSKPDAPRRRHWLAGMFREGA